MPTFMQSCETPKIVIVINEDRHLKMIAEEMDTQVPG